jgi:hypothetical protein
LEQREAVSEKAEVRRGPRTAPKTRRQECEWLGGEDGADWNPLPKLGGVPTAARPHTLPAGVLRTV